MVWVPVSVYIGPYAPLVPRNGPLFTSKSRSHSSQSCDPSNRCYLFRLWNGQRAISFCCNYLFPVLHRERACLRQRHSKLGQKQDSSNHSEGQTGPRCTSSAISARTPLSPLYSKNRLSWQPSCQIKRSGDNRMVSDR